MQYRENEKHRIWFRSERIFSCNDKFYFHTREGIDVGPYDSQFEAEIEAGMVKELLKDIQTGPAAIAVIREFILESYSMGRPLLPTFAHEDLEGRERFTKV